MDVEKLKQKILDLAIRGKLVPQDPNDEPASVLIEKIRAEKEKLVKEGKIKAVKEESYIYKGSDNFYYEKNSIPRNWILCKFGDIVNICRGASPRPIKEHLTSDPDGIPWIKIGDTKPGDIYIEKTAQRIKRDSAKHSVYLNAGSLVLSNSMSFGRPYILKIDGCIHDGWLAIEIFGETINIEFLQYILQGYMWFFKSKATGTGVDNLNIDRVKEMPFALPPFQEQKRILERLLLFDSLINNISQDINLINRYSELIKVKILDSIFGENSSYKSYYQQILLKDVCKLDKGQYTFGKVLPYLEAKVIRGIKEAKIIDSGILIEKGTDVILVDGENSGEVMTAPCDGYMGSTFRILKADYSKVTRDYLLLFLLFNKQLFKDNKKGSAIPHLNKKIFNELKIVIPDLPAQQSITKKINNELALLDLIG